MLGLNYTNWTLQLMFLKSNDLIRRLAIVNCIVFENSYHQQCAHFSLSSKYEFFLIFFLLI